MAIVSQTDVREGFVWPELRRGRVWRSGRADSVVTFAHKLPAASARYWNQVVALRSGRHSRIRVEGSPFGVPWCAGLSEWTECSVSVGLSALAKRVDVGLTQGEVS
jgi:hypothetical protein